MKRFLIAVFLLLLILVFMLCSCKDKNLIGEISTTVEVTQGTTQETTQEETIDLSDCYDVKTYGAYGDGKHDDTAAFQRCLEAADGKPIIVPSGTYIINNTDNNSVKYTGNIVMIGQGLPKLIRKKTSDQIAKSQKYQPMITIRDCKYGYVTGIKFDGQRDNFVDKSTNEWIGTASLYFLGNSSNITVKDCIFENCSREAVYCGGHSENILISHNTFNKVSANFWAHGGNIKNLIFENNTSICGRTKAVELDIENGYRGEDIIVRGNKFTKLVQVAVMISNCHNVLVENNEYDYWTESMYKYSKHMGSYIKSEPYLVFASTAPGGITDASSNYCSDIIVRNNKAVCDRLVNLKNLESCKGVNPGDIIYKNVSVYNNIANCNNCLIRANSADNIISEDNQVSGKLTMGLHSVGTDVSNIKSLNDVIVD